MTKWQIAIEAQSVDGTGFRRVGIPESKLAGLFRFGDVKKLARLRLVADVLKSPYAIVQGWDRPERDGCSAYVGSPLSDFHSERVEVPSPRGMVFVVFLLADGTIDDWNWRKAHDEDPCLAEGLKGEILWMRQT